MAIRPAQNVIQLFGVCDDALDGKLRIVMELCTHGSLRDYVKSLSSSQVCGLHVCVGMCGYVWVCVWSAHCTGLVTVPSSGAAV